MTRYAAFLRAVNVGGTGKLPMADLRAMCDAIGFGNVQTYIASGNVAFDWAGDAVEAVAALEACLAEYAGRPVGVMVRNADAMAQIVAACPFGHAPGNKVVTIFLDSVPPTDVLEQAVGVNGELMALGRREIYVHYVQGQGASKLRIPATATGTARNMNTVRKLCEMVGG